MHRHAVKHTVNTRADKNAQYNSVSDLSHTRLYSLKFKHKKTVLKMFKIQTAVLTATYGCYLSIHQQK